MKYLAIIKGVCTMITVEILEGVAIASWVTKMWIKIGRIFLQEAEFELFYQCGGSKKHSEVNLFPFVGEWKAL